MELYQKSKIEKGRTMQTTGWSDENYFSSLDVQTESCTQRYHKVLVINLLNVVLIAYRYEAVLKELY